MMQLQQQWVRRRSVFKASIAPAATPSNVPQPHAPEQKDNCNTGAFLKQFESQAAAFIPGVEYVACCYGPTYMDPQGADKDPDEIAVPLRGQLQYVGKPFRHQHLAAADGVRSYQDVGLITGQHVGPVDGGVYISFRLYDNEEGRMMHKLIENGSIRSVSIGHTYLQNVVTGKCSDHQIEEVSGCVLGARPNTFILEKRTFDENKAVERANTLRSTKTISDFWPLSQQYAVTTLEPPSFHALQNGLARQRATKSHVYIHPKPRPVLTSKDYRKYTVAMASVGDTVPAASPVPQAIAQLSEIARALGLQLAPINATKPSSPESGTLSSPTSPQSQQATGAAGPQSMEGVELTAAAVGPVPVAAPLMPPAALAPPPQVLSTLPLPPEPMHAVASYFSQGELQTRQEILHKLQELAQNPHVSQPAIFELANKIAQMDSEHISAKQEAMKHRGDAESKAKQVMYDHIYSVVKTLTSQIQAMTGNDSTSSAGVAETVETQRKLAAFKSAIDMSAPDAEVMTHAISLLGDSQQIVGQLVGRLQTTHQAKADVVSALDSLHRRWAGQSSVMAGTPSAAACAPVGAVPAATTGAAGMPFASAASQQSVSVSASGEDGSKRRKRDHAAIMSEDALKAAVYEHFWKVSSG